MATREVDVRAPNPLDHVRRQMQRAVAELGVDAGVFDILAQPKRFVEVAIPVRMDDGTVRVFTGYRSQHNDALGPYKGGVRFHPLVTADEVKALSTWMTLKRVSTAASSRRRA